MLLYETHMFGTINTSTLIYKVFMNIDNVLVASNKRCDIMCKIQKSETVNNWVVYAFLATWVGAVAADSIAPTGTTAMVVGSALVTSAAAFAALRVQKGLRKKSIRNLENTIIGEGKDKEKRDGARFNATQKLNTKIMWAYTVGGIATAAIGYQAIEAIAPSLGVAWMKAALIVATSLTSYKLGSKAADKAYEAREERSSLADKIVKRHEKKLVVQSESFISTDTIVKRHKSVAL